MRESSAGWSPGPEPDLGSSQTSAPGENRASGPGTTPGNTTPDNATPGNSAAGNSAAGNSAAGNSAESGWFSNRSQPGVGTEGPPGPQGSPGVPPRQSTRRSLVQMAVAVAVVVSLFIAFGLSNLLIFIVALIVVVFLHELGHYLTAKWSHMKVTEFFIGFGPRIWSVRKGETEYGLKPIPAGAYVKIPGMNNIDQVDPADEARTYRQQPFRKRILVASAGSMMHFLIALVLGFVLAVALGVPTGTRLTVTGFTHWAGHRETAAQLAGLKSGDTIESVDGKRVTTTTQLTHAIQAAKGHPITVVVERGGRRSTLTVQPQLGHSVGSHEVLGEGTGKEKSRWLIGIGTGEAQVFTAKNPLGAIAWAGNNVGNITRLEVLGIGHVFSPGGLASLYHQVTNSRAAKSAAANPGTSNRPLTVVEIARLETQAEAKGAYYFIAILIALNIVFGLLNMFPMLPLDGGHVAVAIYERIRTRRGRPYYQADVRKLMPVVYAFIAVLVIFVGSALFLDIAHPLANPFG